METLITFAVGAFIGATIASIIILAKQNRDIDWLIGGLRELERTYPFILEDLEKALGE